MFQFKVRTPDRLVTSDVRAALQLAAPDGRVSFVSPHDDDALLGAGLLLHALVKAGVPADVIIVTDGRMGYQRLIDREEIVAIRRIETIKAYGMLGLSEDSLHWLGFPDARLVPQMGRWRAAEDELRANGGYAGLENSLVAAFRMTRPSHVFFNSALDEHPDHLVTFIEGRWALFVAAGKCWGELGEGNFPRRPRMFQYGVYAPPAAPLTMMIESQSAFDRLRMAIACYHSQGDIGGLVQQLEAAGPVEFHAEFEWQKADKQAQRLEFDW